MHSSGQGDATQSQRGLHASYPYPSSTPAPGQSQGRDFGSEPRGRTSEESEKVHGERHCENPSDVSGAGGKMENELHQLSAKLEEVACTGGRNAFECFGLMPFFKE